jgi:ABC-type branched-subunit amino acid transport system substrate-binding protein
MGPRSHYAPYLQSCILPLVASVFFLAGCQKRETLAPVRGETMAFESSVDTERLQGNTIEEESLTPMDHEPSPQAIPPQEDHQASFDPEPAMNVPAHHTQQVALLLPLTGKHQNLGRALQQSAELALFEKADAAFELMILDTKSTPLGAEQAAEKAAQNGAGMILGPIFADDVKAVAPVARRHHLNVVSFSNNPEMSGHGIFVLGYAPEEQLEQGVRYAQEQGLEKFAFLLPRNDLGRLMEQAIGRLKASGVQVVGVMTYGDLTPAALSKTLDPLVTQEVDALFIPEGGKSALALVNAWHQIKPQGKKVQLLGSSQWAEPSVYSAPAVQGAWVVGGDPTARRTFDTALTRAHGEKDYPAISALSYDAVSMVTILKKHFSQDPFALTALTQERGFEGVDGVFRLNQTGRCERLLTLMKINQGGLEVLKAGSGAF